MATYAELATLMKTPGALLDKITVACIIAAEAIRTEALDTVNHPKRLKWAIMTMQNPESSGKSAIQVVLAQNASFTLTQIQSATDSAIQTAVNAAINLLAENM